MPLNPKSRDVEGEFLLWGTEGFVRESHLSFRLVSGLWLSVSLQV